MCYFDTFIYCNMVAVVMIFISLHAYSTILFNTHHKCIPLRTINLISPSVLPGNHCLLFS